MSFADTTPIVPTRASDPSNVPGVELVDISVRFGSLTVVSHVNLSIKAGEFFTFVGPSGCGKSTLLSLVAGVEAPSDGAIWFDDERIDALAPGQRDVAMVFQSYALYPHLSVRDNLAFPLRARGRKPAEIATEVAEVARMLGLTELLDRKPRQLSGGQRQRVALGRALVRRPKVFLMDEPLSNLDARLRLEMREELRRLHASYGITTIYVTHDQEEAMALSDRLAVISGGEVLQVGAPRMSMRGRGRFGLRSSLAKATSCAATQRGKAVAQPWCCAVARPLPQLVRGPIAVARSGLAFGPGRIAAPRPDLQQHRWHVAREDLSGVLRQLRHRLRSRPAHFGSGRSNCGSRGNASGLASRAPCRARTGDDLPGRRQGGGALSASAASGLRARRPAYRLTFWTGIAIGALILFLGLLIYPLARLLISSMSGTGGGSETVLRTYVDFFTKKYYYETLIHSLSVSALATVTATALGAPLAYVINRFNVPGKLLLRAMIVLTFVSPPFIGAYAWILLLLAATD